MMNNKLSKFNKLQRAMTGRKRLCLILLCLAMMFSLSSCSTIEKITEKITGGSSGETASDDKKANSSDSDKISDGAEDASGADGSADAGISNIVFYVDSTPVSIGEWNLYAIPRIEGYANLYGDSIWSYRVDSSGKEFRDVFKEDVLDEIAYTKIVAARAGEMGIGLSEDDNIEISINIADYLEKTNRKQRENYQISEEVLRTLYTDNILAMKVYEHITLNIDTKMDDKEVRHMVLQYVMLPKTYEDEEGVTKSYEGQELEILRTRFQNYKQFLNGQPGITLKAAEYADFTATQIITDYRGILERFPAELADGIFALTDGEISSVKETEDAFFIFNCIKANDEESTNEAKIMTLEQRERDCFNEKYEIWEKEAVITKNDKLWHELKYPEN
ncbi:MAG: hypothetical protein MJ131_09875 [Lachnospiraceae bacterium]|nr:hypothetical protein [Lachnospiraceae bacterium]